MPPSPPAGGAPKLKLKFGGGGASSTSAPAPPSASTPTDPAKQAKRKYVRKPKPDAVADGVLSPTANKTPKKRARKDDDDEDDEDASRKVPKRAGGLKLRIGGTSKPAPQQISFTEAGALPKKGATDALKVKLRTPSQQLRIVHGKAPSQLPPREAGTGYDSEAESVEEDPLIEQQFVIRMLPGPDCEYLREAITTRKIGASAANGGADVRMRFLQRDGRRAMISIRGNHYVAFMVDLPCIVESLKSWDRKNFYKAADIHQMLLVTQQVKDEAEAKSATLPTDVGISEGSWQYGHGLTPPMHWVRKRRFRKRISHRTIEEIENQVERLLELDEQCIKEGGATTATLFDPHAREEEELDAEGEEDVDMIQESIEPEMDEVEMDEVAEEEEEDDVLAQLLAAEFDREDNDADAAAPLTTITGRILASPDTLTQDATPVDVSMARTHVTGTVSATSSAPPVNEPLSTQQQQRAQTEDEEEEDSDDDEEEEEMDEEEMAAQQEKTQQLEEIAEIEGAIEELNKRIAGFANQMLAMKFREKRDKLVRDLKLKKRNMGEEVGSDEE